MLVSFQPLIKMLRKVLSQNELTPGVLGHGFVMMPCPATVPTSAATANTSLNDKSMFVIVLTFLKRKKNEASLPSKNEWFRSFFSCG